MDKQSEAKYDKKERRIYSQQINNKKLTFNIYIIETIIKIKIFPYLEISSNILGT